MTNGFFGSESLCDKAESVCEARVLILGRRQGEK